MLYKLFACVMVCLAVNVAFAGEKISDYKELNELLVFMDESLDLSDVYFNYELDFNTVPCSPRIVEKNQFIKQLVGVVDIAVGPELLTAEQDANDLQNFLEVELNQLLKLFGPGPYLLCEGQEKGYMTFGKLYYFASKEFKIIFEFGYED